MSNSEVIDHIASTASLDEKSSVAAVYALLDEIVTGVSAGDNGSRPGFGVFSNDVAGREAGPQPSHRRADRDRRVGGCAVRPGFAVHDDPQRQERGQQVGPREGGQGTCESGQDLHDPSSKGMAGAAQTAMKR